MRLRRRKSVARIGTAAAKGQEFGPARIRGGDPMRPSEGPPQAGATITESIRPVRPASRRWEKKRSGSHAVHCGSAST